MSDNWNLEVKFQGTHINLVGRLPAEKRELTKEFPKKLNVSTKAKLTAIPSKGFFCKFFAKNTEEMKMYMRRNDCALCVNFSSSIYDFTLFLICPIALRGLKCLKRLKQSGVSSDAIQSLCTERHGIVIGFIVSQVNTSRIEKKEKEEKQLEEATQYAKSISNAFSDPMLELDYLMDQLDTKPNLIPICAKLMIKHQENYQVQICQKIVNTMDLVQNHFKSKLNLFFLIHDVFTRVRGHILPSCSTKNEEMKKNPLVNALSNILYRLYDKLSKDEQKTTQIQNLVEYWKKWTLNYNQVPQVEVDHHLEPITTAATTNATNSSIDHSTSTSTSTTGTDHTTTTTDTSATTGSSRYETSVEVQAFMRKFSIQAGAWEVYLSNATSKELKELTTACEINTKYHQLQQQQQQRDDRDNRGNRDNRGGGQEEETSTNNQNLPRRQTGEFFLLNYVKQNLPILMSTSFKSSSSSSSSNNNSSNSSRHCSSIDSTMTTIKRKREITQSTKKPKSYLDILRLALLSTYDLDHAAEKAVMSEDVNEELLDFIWTKMEQTSKCLNPSAFVFGKIRRMKTLKYAKKNPEIDQLLNHDVVHAKHLTQQELVLQVVRIFQLDSIAKEKLLKIPHKQILIEIIQQLCERCRDRMVANPSIHIVKLCQQQMARLNPRNAYSIAMKSMMHRQMKLFLRPSYTSSSSTTTTTTKIKSKQQQQQRRRQRKKQKTQRQKEEGEEEEEEEEEEDEYEEDEDDSYGTFSSAEEDEEADNDLPLTELSDAQLAAIKRRIPKPPKLLFKKVDLNTIQYTETNDNGKVGVAISGIPNAGRGLFNLSSKPWPAFSVVCIFGVRRITEEEHHDHLNKVARVGELGETFVVVNGSVRDVETFQTQYGHRLVPYDGLVDAEGSVGGFPNDRVYEYPESVYWDASGFYNNCILVPGCIIENPQDTTSPVQLDQLYIVTWKEVGVHEEFFLAYGTSYYEDDYEKDGKTPGGGRGGRVRQIRR